MKKTLSLTPVEEMALNFFTGVFKEDHKFQIGEQDSYNLGLLVRNLMKKGELEAEVVKLFSMFYSLSEESKKEYEELLKDSKYRGEIKRKMYPNRSLINCLINEKNLRKPDNIKFYL